MKTIVLPFSVIALIVLTCAPPATAQQNLELVPLVSLKKSMGEFS